MVTIEQARKATALRARLDKIDELLRHKPHDTTPTTINLLNGGSWAQWHPSRSQLAELMEIRARPLRAERLMILAEAAEAGLIIEDATA